MQAESQPLSELSMELSMELSGLEDSMRSIDLGVEEEAAELAGSGEAVSPNRMAELERMFPPESGGAMVATPAAATVAVTQTQGPACGSMLVPGARVPDDCLLQIFRWLRPWPDLAVVRCHLPA